MTRVLLRFVHLSDTHYAPLDTIGPRDGTHAPAHGVHALLDAVAALPFTPTFVLHTGDVAYDPYPHVYSDVAALLARLPAPQFVLAGNHDDGPALRAALGQPAAAPASSEHDVDGVQLLLLDTNGPEADPPTGHITDAQVAWLRARATPDDPRPLVVAAHHHLVPLGDVPWHDDWMIARHGLAAHQALLPARDRLRGVYHGHIHMPNTTVRDGVMYVAAASSWRQFYAWPGGGQRDTVHAPSEPPGFNVVTITDVGVTVQRVTFPRPPA